MNLNKLILTSLCAIITATAAFAAGENVVASKKYTDDTFQTKIPAEVSTLSDITGNAGALIGATDANGVVSQRLIIPGYKSASGNGELGAAMYEQSGDGTELWGAWDDFTVDSFAGTLDDIYRQLNDANGMGYEPQYSVPSMELALNWVGDIGDKLSDINGQLVDIDESKQPMIPAGTAGNVVTYTGTAGVVGSNTVASAATYNQQTGALTNGSSIANVTLVETKQKKKVCAGWPDYVAVADRTDANCWLWSLPD